MGYYSAERDIANYVAAHCSFHEKNAWVGLDEEMLRVNFQFCCIPKVNKGNEAHEMNETMRMQDHITFLLRASGVQNHSIRSKYFLNMLRKTENML